jgi:uncharacterized membrane protein
MEPVLNVNIIHRCVYKVYILIIDRTYYGYFYYFLFVFILFFYTLINIYIVHDIDRKWEYTIGCKEWKPK